MGIRYGFEGKLTAVKIKALTKPGHYGDGGNLYLQISGAGTKSWCLRFTQNGRRREMGLGKFPIVPLLAAREASIAARQSLMKEIDPIAERADRRLKAKLAPLRSKTFRECARLCIESKKAGWRNPKHAKQWSATLEAYAFPTLGGLRADQVTQELVIKVLHEIWATKHETASRLRSRIEAVLSWATVHKHREGLNPARWKGHLDQTFVSKIKARRVKHLRALEYKKISPFMEDLKNQSGTASLAAEFTILTAGRTNEILKASWSEIDLDMRVWSIPGERMKAGKPHNVPLSSAAMDVLERAKRLASDGYVFPGQRKSKPLSNMAMLVLLRRMNRSDITMHGFRSTFRDWAANAGISREVAELCLAHINQNKVEAAYLRDDLFDRRKACLEAWAAHCFLAKSPSNNVVALRSGHN